MASQIRPFSLTNQPPAPSGSQYSSMLAWEVAEPNGDSAASAGLSWEAALGLISPPCSGRTLAARGHQHGGCWWPRLAADGSDEPAVALDEREPGPQPAQAPGATGVSHGQ